MSRWGYVAVVMMSGCSRTPSTAEPMPDAGVVVPEGAGAKMSDTTPTTRAQVHSIVTADGDFDDPDLLEDALDSVDDSETDGLRIDAPFVIDPDATDSFPIVGVYTRRPTADEDFVQRAVLVAVGIDDGVLRTAPALRTDKRRVHAGEQVEAVIGEPFSLDLRERLDAFPWSAARHRVYVLHQVHVSNGVTVAMGSSANNPGTTASETLELSVPNAAVTEPGGTVMVQGGGAGAGAAVFVLGTGPATGPFVQKLQADEEGAFSVNLLGANALPKAPGTWHLYAFSAEDSAGPASVTLRPGAKPW